MIRRLFITAVLVAAAACLLSWVPEDPRFEKIPEPLRPYRPVWVRMLNVLLDLVPENVKSLKPEDLLADAKARAGGGDVEDEDGLLEEGLRRLSQSIEEQAKLTPLGRLLIKEQIVAMLTNRIRINEYRKTHPEILTPLRSPVFTIGMPRSGTTFLHNLLSQDTTRVRPMRAWEFLDPVPPTKGSQIGWKDWMLKVLPAHLGMGVFKALGPSVARVYPVGAENAEECMPILAMGFVSLHFNVLANVSIYNEWQMDKPPPFRFHERFFQVLQNGGDGAATRWLFKAPWHMNHIEALFKAYPDATVLMPHRDPTGFLASLSSLHARFYGIATDNINASAIGRYQLDTWKRVAKKYIAEREALPAAQKERVIDVHFKELIKDPIGTVRRIYTSLEWELTPDAEESMRRWLAEDKRLVNKKARKEHEYEPEWFGITEEEVAEAFADYCAAYNVPTKYRHSRNV